MKKLLTILAVFCVCITSVCFAQVYVKGYFRKDGTYVAPHYRTSPDSTVTNNYSYPGNYNPNTGEITGGSTYNYSFPSSSSTNYYDASSYLDSASTTNYDFNSKYVYKPSYPVKINNLYIDNYCGNWEPFVYEDITYIPMTSSVMQELGLTSSFDSVTGFNVSNSSNDKAEFLDAYIVIIPTGSDVYHKYGCPYLDLSSFSACNLEIAEDCDFMKCIYCCGF